MLFTNDFCDVSQTLCDQAHRYKVNNGIQWFVMSITLILERHYDVHIIGNKFSQRFGSISNGVRTN